ncbi:rCG21420 [Rattus norvegicus]|uniref:RCG21420 n=1 Tax=Rattus norvegicus TaxID=10116 RepID=A6J0N0_RAT|nr:rCG21420 [Rattus norvegicus]
MALHGMLAQVKHGHRTNHQARQEQVLLQLSNHLDVVIFLLNGYFAQNYCQEMFRPWRSYCRKMSSIWWESAAVPSLQHLGLRPLLRPP